MTGTQRTIVVSGASTGIGHATVTAFLARGWRVFGTVRQQADADRLAAAWGPSFQPLRLDLADPASIERAAGVLATQLGGAGLDGLINNAGVALPGPLAEQPFDQIRAMFEVNVFGMLALTRVCLPLLGMRDDHPRPPGRIINISSGAGKLSIPFLAGYVASKHALEGASASLRRELLPWRIPVVVVGPGNVRTPIWDKVPPESAYQHSAYGETFKNFRRFMLDGEKKGMPAEQIAALLVKIMDARNPRTRYAPVAQRFANWTLPRLLPDKLMDAIMFKTLGMKAAGRAAAPR